MAFLAARWRAVLHCAVSAVGCYWSLGQKIPERSHASTGPVYRMLPLSFMEQEQGWITDRPLS